MKLSIDINKDEFFAALAKYWKAVAKLPPDLQGSCPEFEKFLSPANYTNFSSDPIGLSITGTERIKMLDSPYVVTLLAIYAAQRQER